MIHVRPGLSAVLLLLAGLLGGPPSAIAGSAAAGQSAVRVAGAETDARGEAEAGPQLLPAPAPDTDVSMTLLQSAVLGVVEGVTEYLPVSSTGHLILAQRAMGIGSGSPAEKEAADAFAICIQAGAIVAVLLLYWRRALAAVQGVAGAVGIGARNPDGLRLAINIVAAFLPAACIGFLANDWIKANLFGGERYGLWPTVFAWLVGGVAILVVIRMRRGKATVEGHALEQLAWKQALLIGLLQCIAMWPGVSRSLITIVGGLLVGMRTSAAVEFSFLLGVLTLTAATAYDGLQHGGQMLAVYGLDTLLVGFVVAAVSAAIAVKWMVDYLNRYSMAIFGWYRIALALVVGALVAINVL